MKRDIGVGINPPSKVCNDVKCPWHGKLAIRGKVIEGIVKTARMQRTAIVEWNYFRYIPKYERYERRRSKIKVHVPPCLNVKEGDKVMIAETRKLSKTISFVVVGKKGDNY